MKTLIELGVVVSSSQFLGVKGAIVDGQAAKADDDEEEEEVKGLMIDHHCQAGEKA